MPLSNILLIIGTGIATYISYRTFEIRKRMIERMDAQKVDDVSGTALIWTIILSLILIGIITGILDNNYDGNTLPWPFGLMVGIGYFFSIFCISNTIVWFILSAETESERRKRITRESKAKKPQSHNTSSDDTFSSNYSKEYKNGDYSYKKERFRSDRSGPEQHEDSDREPDYASALRDAQARAAEISDHQAAKFAKVWEKMAKEPGLDPKIRLYRELVAMLLRERAKGFTGRPDDTAPTDDEIKGILFAPDR